MSRITQRFKALRARGERALIPFITAGDPDLETTEALVLALEDAGADLIEIGVPFSDPIAEGPVIQRASERALSRGTSLRQVLELVSRLRDRVEVPLLLMGYVNPIFAMGAVNFAEAASQVGVDGIIVPDLPPEEGNDLYSASSAAGVDPVLLASPTTTPERFRLLAEKTRGFLYYVSLTGVTGTRTSLAGGIEDGVRAAKANGDIPVCVGFGVSSPEHAREIGAYADGVVVGSAIVERVERAPDGAAAVADVSAFVAELKEPLRS